MSKSKKRKAAAEGAGLSPASAELGADAEGIDAELGDDAGDELEDEIPADESAAAAARVILTAFDPEDIAEAAEGDGLSWEERVRRAELERAELERIEREALASRLQWERDNPDAHAKEQRQLAMQRELAELAAERERPPEAAPGVLDDILAREDVQEMIKRAETGGGGGVVAPLPGRKV